MKLDNVDRLVNIYRLHAVDDDDINYPSRHLKKILSLMIDDGNGALCPDILNVNRAMEKKFNKS